MQFMSCKHEDGINLDSKISLKAPSGVIIACSLDELIQFASATIEPSLKTNIKDMKILAINYLPVKSGFAAIIEYTINGVESNFAYVDYPKVAYSATTLKSAKMPGIVPNRQQVSVSCAGTCGCRVEGMIKPDGTITFGCSCTDCTATISYP